MTLSGKLFKNHRFGERENDFDYRKILKLANLRTIWIVLD